MMDLKEKKRRNLKLVLILGNAGMFVGTVNILALSRIPTPSVSIIGAAIFVILAIAFVLFLGDRSPVGRAALLVLPEIRVYAALISMLMILSGILRTMVVLGVERSTSLSIITVVLLCGYVVAILPQTRDFLSRHGYPTKGIHVLFLLSLAATVVSFALVVI